MLQVAVFHGCVQLCKLSCNIKLNMGKIMSNERLEVVYERLSWDYERLRAMIERLAVVIERL